MDQAALLQPGADHGHRKVPALPRPAQREAVMGTAGSRVALRAPLHEGCGGAAPAACWEPSQAEESLNAAQG